MVREKVVKVARLKVVREKVVKVDRMKAMRMKVKLMRLKVEMIETKGGRWRMSEGEENALLSFPSYCGMSASLAFEKSISVLLA